MAATTLSPGAPSRIITLFPAGGELGRAVPVIRAALVTLAALLIGVGAQMMALGSAVHRVDQVKELDRFRNALANGTAPTGSITAAGRALESGTPVALLAIPSIHLSQVVEEGTSSPVLTAGPGHLPDSAFPGQEGTSEILGRAGAYGGPFAELSHLVPGDALVVTTQVGRVTYRITDVRRTGSPLPPALKAGQGRLTLVTATESYLVPTGLLYVDATASGLPSGQQLASDANAAVDGPLDGDNQNLLELAFWVEALAAAVVGGIWAWHKWGHAQAWIGFAPPVAFLGFEVTAGIVALLPNLL